MGKFIIITLHLSDCLETWLRKKALTKGKKAFEEIRGKQK